MNDGLESNLPSEGRINDSTMQLRGFLKVNYIWNRMRIRCPYIVIRYKEK